MEASTETRSDVPLLVKTETCPACRTAVALLERAGVAYRTLSNVGSPDTRAAYDAAVARYGIRHVPTLILRPEDDPPPAGERRILVGIEEIRAYLAAGR